MRKTFLRTFSVVYTGFYNIVWWNMRAVCSWLLCAILQALPVPSGYVVYPLQPVEMTHDLACHVFLDIFVYLAVICVFCNWSSVDVVCITDLSSVLVPYSPIPLLFGLKSLCQLRFCLSCCLHSWRLCATELLLPDKVVRTSHEIVTLFGSSLLGRVGGKSGMLGAINVDFITHTCLWFPPSPLVLIVLVTFICWWYASSCCCTHELYA